MEIEYRRIICDDAYRFQGDERYVMFLIRMEGGTGLRRARNTHWARGSHETVGGFPPHANSKPSRGRLETCVGLQCDEDSILAPHASTYPALAEFSATPLAWQEPRQTRRQKR